MTSFSLKEDFIPENTGEQKYPNIGLQSPSSHCRLKYATFYQMQSAHFQGKTIKTFNDCAFKLQLNLYKARQKAKE